MRGGVFACVALGVAACAAAPVQDASSASASSATTSSATTSSQNKISAQQEVAKPSSGSATSATAASPVDATAQFQSTDAMLSALEKAGDTIRSLRANVIYDRVDAVSENRERRTGQIVLTQDSQQLKSRTLAIMFDQFIDASGHASPQTQRFVFHGGWLFEFDDARHQLIARELVAPGEQLDPLRIGEGPVPIPIGQKKDEVLRRFEVQLAPLPEQPLLKRLVNIQGLVMRPKLNAGVDPDLAEINVWYDLGTLMPVAVAATTKGGDQKILLLTKLELNKELDVTAKALLATDPPATTDKGAAWRRDVRPYKPTP
jgi:hypothetical protein